MNFLEYYNQKIIKHDIVNKFAYHNNDKIPSLKKIVLNFGGKNFNIQKFAITLLALEIITKKKSGITISKSANVLLKIQKGHPAGCKVVLKKKEMYGFLARLFLEVLPKLKNFSGFKLGTKTSNFSFKLLQDQIILQEFEEQYPLFTNLPDLDITISIYSQTKDERLFLIKSLKFPLLK